MGVGDDAQRQRKREIPASNNIFRLLPSTATSDSCVKIHNRTSDDSSMNWLCAACGCAARTNRKKCPKCGGLVWRPAPKRNSTEPSGPMKRIAPRGLLLANPGKQAPVEDPGEIKCGKCQMVIYRVDKRFDVKALEEARKMHYSISPACRGAK